MKIKAKSSYKNLEDKNNPLLSISPAKHHRLMLGETVEMDSVPNALKEHLSDTQSNIKSKKKKEK